LVRKRGSCTYCVDYCNGAYSQLVISLFIPSTIAAAVPYPRRAPLALVRRRQLSRAAPLISHAVQRHSTFLPNSNTLSCLCVCPALLFRYTHLKLKPATKGDGSKPLISVHTAGLRGRSGPMSPNSMEGGLGGCMSWQSGWMAYFGWGAWVRAQTGRGVGIVAF
jgi:hypothetical protein